MSRRRYVNNAAVVELSGSITNSATSITVSNASSFPAQFPWTAVIDAGLTAAEIVLVTAAAANVLTVTRGYDGTSGQAHANAAAFAHVAVKADYDEANAHINLSAGVHGVVGSVVGTTDTQTLSAKTLTAPTITAPVVTGGASVAGTLTTAGITATGTVAVTGGITATTSVAATGAVTGASVTTTGDVTAGGRYQGAVARGLLSEARGGGTVSLSGFTFHAPPAGDGTLTFTLPGTRRVRIYAVASVGTAMNAGVYQAQVAYESGSSITVGGSTALTPTMSTYAPAAPSTITLPVESTVLLTAGTWTVAPLAARVSGGNASDDFACTYVAVYDVGNA